MLFDSTNMVDAWCSVCGGSVPKETGLKLRSPLRLLCGECSLVSPVPNEIDGPIAALAARGLVMRDFQIEDARIMASKRRLLNGSQMGSGKTISAAMGCLRADAVNLVVVPAGLRRNWLREVTKWRPDLTVVFEPASMSKALAIYPDGVVVIGSYDGLPGASCRGCKALKRLLRDAKKKAHVGPCQHRDEASRHAEKFEISNKESIPYHVKSDGTPCPGCWQNNPTPVVRRRVVLLCDEAHALKDPTTIRVKLWRRLREAVTAADGWVFGLTGTPWENHPDEGWEVLVSLGLERIAFASHEDYRSIFMDCWYSQPKGSRSGPKNEHLARFMTCMRRVRIHRRTRDVLSLPPQVLQDIEVEIGTATLNRVNEAVQRMFAQRRAWHDVQAHELENPYEPGLSEDEAERRKQKFEERCGRYYIEKPWDYDMELMAAVKEVIDNPSPAFTEIARIRRLLSMAKIDAVEKWLHDCEEQDEPVVLFCMHVEVVRKFGGAPGWTAYHGKMGHGERDQSLNAFQDGKIPNGIAVSLGCGREGITLTRARVAGFVDLNWNPSRNAQARARLARIGAEKHESLLFVRFVANHPVDRLVIKTLEEKESLVSALNDDMDTEVD
jgi:hypothetical protein